MSKRNTGTMRVEGLREIDRALKQLDQRVAKRILRRAVKIAAEPPLHAVRSNAPMDTGLYVSQINVRTRVRRWRNRKGAAVTAMVEAKSRSGKTDAFYGAFLEYGTSRMPADPHFRPAFEMTKEESRRILLRELSNGLEREAKRVARAALRAERAAAKARAA
ncbi:MAG: hypothetical protein EA379_09555 [Phycisphaerales bacterium]|nr:MAG: hypothetical protein EA379_09555 [Phycisphaerales bacterium]